MIFPIRRKKWKYGTPRWITSNCMKFQNWPCSSGSGTQWNMKHFDEIRCESISGNTIFFKWRQLNCYESFKTYVTFWSVCIIFLCTDAFILHSNQTYNSGGGPMLKEGTPDTCVMAPERNQPQYQQGWQRCECVGRAGHGRHVKYPLS